MNLYTVDCHAIDDLFQGFVWIFFNETYDIHSQNELQSKEGLTMTRDIQRICVNAWTIERILCKFKTFFLKPRFLFPASNLKRTTKPVKNP